MSKTNREVVSEQILNELNTTQTIYMVRMRNEFSTKSVPERVCVLSDQSYTNHEVQSMVSMFYNEPVECWDVDEMVEVISVVNSGISRQQDGTFNQVVSGVYVDLVDSCLVVHNSHVIKEYGTDTLKDEDEYGLDDVVSTVLDEYNRPLVDQVGKVSLDDVLELSGRLNQEDLDKLRKQLVNQLKTTR